MSDLRSDLRVLALGYYIEDSFHYWYINLSLRNIFSDLTLINLHSSKIPDLSSFDLLVFTNSTEPIDEVFDYDDFRVLRKSLLPKIAISVDFFSSEYHHLFRSFDFVFSNVNREYVSTKEYTIKKFDRHHQYKIATHFKPKMRHRYLPDLAFYIPKEIIHINTVNYRNNFKKKVTIFFPEEGFPDLNSYKEEYDVTFVNSISNNFEDLLHLVSQQDYCICYTYYSIIICILMKVPFLVLYKGRKIKFLILQYDLEEYFFYNLANLELKFRLLQEDENIKSKLEKIYETNYKAYQELNLGKITNTYLSKLVKVNQTVKIPIYIGLFRYRLNRFVDQITTSEHLEKLFRLYEVLQFMASETGESIYLITKDLHIRGREWIGILDYDYIEIISQQYIDNLNGCRLLIIPDFKARNWVHNIFYLFGIKIPIKIIDYQKAKIFDFLNL